VTSLAHLTVRVVKTIASLAVIAAAFITLITFINEGRFLIVEGSAVLALVGGLALVALQFVQHPKAIRR
jgi:hypothetical protein